MNPVARAVLLIAFDLAAMLMLLLVLTYLGMSHVFLLVAGILFFWVTVYDSRTGRLSALFALIFSLPGPAEKGRLNWIPALLSLVLIIYSIPLLIKHGMVNQIQRVSMQAGLFPRFAIYAIAATSVDAAIAVYTVIFYRGKR